MVDGGGAGGDGKSGGNGNGLVGSQPGGGGGGARGTSTGSQTFGGTGGAGQIILTVQALAKAGSTISVTGSTSFTYNGNEQGPDTSTVTGSGGSVSYSYEGASGTSYPASGTKPTAVGSYKVTATVTADTNYDTATSSAYAFTIVASSTAFASWSGNAAVTSEFVYKYAYGAADKNSAVQEMTSSIVDGKLSMTAVVRTGDPKLVITPKSATSLTGTWSAVDPAIIVTDGDSTGLGTGLFRKVFTVDRAVSLDTKRFLKLEAVYTP